MEIRKLHYATGLDHCGGARHSQYKLAWPIWSFGLGFKIGDLPLPPPSPMRLHRPIPASRWQEAGQGVARDVAGVERNPIRGVGGTRAHQQRWAMVRKSAAEQTRLQPRQTVTGYEEVAEEGRGALVVLLAVVVGPEEASGEGGSGVLARSGWSLARLEGSCYTLRGRCWCFSLAWSSLRGSGGGGRRQADVTVRSKVWSEGRGEGGCEEAKCDLGALPLGTGAGIRPEPMLMAVTGSDWLLRLHHMVSVVTGEMVGVWDG
jgi:hypothetical protein